MSHPISFSNVLVVGDTGLLGQAVIRFAQNKVKVFGVSSSAAEGARFDYPRFVLSWPSSPVSAWEKVIMDNKIDLIFNAAACASIPDCENLPEKSGAVNVAMPAVLAAIARRRGIAFLHISSDQVFDGRSRKPYKEEDATGPLNAYGRMKRESEIKVLEANPEALVVRTNIVGFRLRGGATFAEWLFDSLANHKPITLFDNYVTSSMHVDLLVPMIFEALAKKASGILHMVSSESASKYDFGMSVCRVMGWKGAAVTKSSMRSADFTPPRPEYLALDVARAAEFTGSFPDTEQTVLLLCRDYKKHFQGAAV